MGFSMLETCNKFEKLYLCSKFIVGHLLLGETPCSNWDSSCTK